VLSLSVVQSIKFDLVINLKRQGARPWEPPVLLARADE
jgi:hypothetical protein